MISAAQHRSAFTLSCFGILLACVAQASGQPRHEFAKLLAEDRLQGDQLGFLVAIDGQTAVAGAPERDELGRQSGAAYVFDGGDGWAQAAKLLAADGDVEDAFGRSVAISGDLIVVGAPGDNDNGTDSGAAYIFRRIGGVWEQTDKILADDGQEDDGFGRHVAISGQTVAVAARGQDEAAEDAGAIYIFVVDEGRATQTQKLTADGSMAGDGLGWVAIDGDVLVIASSGADRSGEINVGVAFIFERIDGTWRQAAELMDDQPAQLGGFGNTVGVSGRTVLIAANSNDRMGDNAGAVFVFEKTNGRWVQSDILFSPEPMSAQEFGSSAGISGDRIIVGAVAADSLAGAAYPFERVGDAWVAGPKLVGADTQTFDFLGLSAAISGRYAVAGAPFHDDDARDSGAAYVFDLGGTPCRADFDGDGELTVFDFLDFSTAFDAGDPAADFDGDGELTLFDFLTFSTEFDAGCP